jgi:putative ABC transport system permease protein
VVKDPPHNTNLPFDAIHFPEIQSMFIGDMPEASQWTYFDQQLYVKLNVHTDVKNLAGQLRDFTSQLGVNDKIELRLLPISDVRHQLNSDLPFTLGFIRLFVAAGLLLLFSAFFNFLNLHLGLFRQRIHELRQRMVNGATSWQLVIQMMFELTLAILLTLVFAWLIVVLVFPLFSELLNISAETSRLFYQFIVNGALVTVLALTIGIFPLWRLSRSALRNLAKRKPDGQPLLRRAAVALQLSVSVVFIIAALTVMMQMRFVNHKDLGFDRHGIVQLSSLSGTNRQQRTALMHELTAMPQIESITQTAFEPKHEDNAMITEVEWQGKTLHEKPAFQSIITDHDFAETFKLKMMQGKWWNEGERQKIVLNEEAVRAMGLNDPVGTVIRLEPDLIMSTGDNPMQEYEVVGVVNDFHSLSLRSRIYPAIFRESMFGGSIIYIRVVSGQEQEVMKRIASILPDINVTLADASLTPLNELYTRLNSSEQAGLKIFSVLASVCLLISLFGIYAVATASTQRRRKEIAIRKVVGASIFDIVLLLSKEFFVLATASLLIAIPVAWLIMDRWLLDYAYRINISWQLFAVVATSTIAIALLTVSFQTIRAAMTNPAKVISSSE